MTTLKIIKYQDAQQHYTKLLKEIEAERKTIATKYQNYLSANPYKEQKKLLEKRREDIIATILYMAGLDIDDFTEKKLAKFKATLGDK